jgi:hypothetical protein
MVGFFSFKFFSFLIPKLLPFLLFYEFTDNKMEAVIDCLFVFCFWIYYMVVGDYKERGITLELKSPKMILKLPVSGLPMVFQFFFFFFNPLIFIENIFLGVFRRKKMGCY